MFRLMISPFTCSFKQEYLELGCISHLSSRDVWSTLDFLNNQFLNIQNHRLIQKGRVFEVFQTVWSSPLNIPIESRNLASLIPHTISHDFILTQKDTAP